MTTHLTNPERKTLAKLAEAWNLFQTLPGSAHTDDTHDFRKAIHDAQRIIMARPAYRDLQNREGYAP